jgi:predicted nucleic acid-binding protein
LLRSPFLPKVDIHDGVLLRARRYAQSHRLHNYDAVHMACAVEASVGVLMTSDKDFPRGQHIDGVWVDEPYIPGDEPIPGL